MAPQVAAADITKPTDQTISVWHWSVPSLPPASKWAEMNRFRPTREGRAAYCNILLSSEICFNKVYLVFVTVCRADALVVNCFVSLFTLRVVDVFIVCLESGGFVGESCCFRGGGLRLFGVICLCFRPLGSCVRYIQTESVLVNLCALTSLLFRLTKNNFIFLSSNQSEKWFPKHFRPTQIKRQDRESISKQIDRGYLLELCDNEETKHPSSSLWNLLTEQNQSRGAFNSGGLVNPLTTPPTFPPHLSYIVVCQAGVKTGLPAL